LSGLDWLVVGGYLGLTLLIGLGLARRGARNLTEFFVGGRAMPWWLAATSMAATTFNVDTPLYVAGKVAELGVAGNWEWWCFALAHVLLAVVLAKIWRRAGVLTDMELTELRYAGRPAAALRASRAFLFAVPLNCLSIGYGMLAMRKVVVALGLLDNLPALPGDPQLWALMPIVLIVLAYTAVAGIWGVVATDFLQYVLALVGAVLVMSFALGDVGGLDGLVGSLRAAGKERHLDLVPLGSDPLMPLSTFLGYLTIQWWAFRNSDGGGLFVQRLASTGSEREATKAAHLFNVLNYVVRTWPWVLVGLAGLVFASLLAAFMSTVSTQVNWGASYLVHDLYARFTGEKDDAKLIRAARLASIGITAVAAVASFYMSSVGQVFRFLILIGNGPGLVLLLRWFWWRVNAWAEIAAMLAGVGLALMSYLPAFGALTFGQRLALTAFGSLAIWLPTMLLTRPEPAATLESFYRRVRPGGAWGPVRRATGLTPLDSLSADLIRWVGWSVVILGTTLLIGAILL